MVIVRKHFFEAKVDHIVEGLISRQTSAEGRHPIVRRLPLSWSRKIMSRIRRTRRLPHEHKQRGSKDVEKVRPDMIRRVSSLPPQLLNPNGQISVKTPTQEIYEKTASFNDAAPELAQIRNQSILETDANRGRSFSVSYVSLHNEPLARNLTLLYTWRF